MTDAERGYCAHCNAEVPAAPNTHRVRNIAAEDFAAANLVLAPRVVSEFGPTCRYVCPYCGEGLKVTSPAPPRPPR
jgi:hypothetical protein